MQKMGRELSQRIKHIVSLSKEIPWYARKYKELGIDPDGIRNPQDLLKAYEKGLYTTPQNLPDLTFYEDDGTKEFFTSGVSGKPKRVCLNPDDEKWWVSQFSKGFHEPFSKEDKILNCLPKHPAVSGYIMNHSLSMFGYSFEHAAAQEIGGDIEKFMNFYKALKPSALICLTTFAYRLPKKLEEIGIKARNLEIKSIAFGGEPSTVERRKKIGEEFNSNIFDWYVSSESGFMACEKKPFSAEYKISLANTLIFLVEDKDQISESEVGNVMVSNLYYPELLKPHAIILNYKIGDWATCLEKNNKGIITTIGNIRRESAYLAGAKFDPTEVEKCIEELEICRNYLSGEYFVVNYTDNNRRAVGEIRVESKFKLLPENKRDICEKIKERIYQSNIPVKTLVEVIKDAQLFIEITDPGELYKGYEQYIKPGKPKRLLVI